MQTLLIRFVFLCASLSALTSVVPASLAQEDQNLKAEDTSVQAQSPVIQWNRTLLIIVRTSGAQPSTVHPTRNFAIMHAAIYDAVNAIDRTHKPYLFHLTGVSPNTSQEAAAAQAAHEVLVNLYPQFQSTLDTQLQQSLAQVPDGADKTD